MVQSLYSWQISLHNISINILQRSKFSEINRKLIFFHHLKWMPWKLYVQTLFLMTSQRSEQRLHVRILRKVIWQQWLWGLETSLVKGQWFEWTQKITNIWYWCWWRYSWLECIEWACLLFYLNQANNPQKRAEYISLSLNEW